MILIQQPATINYSGNLPDFVLESVSTTVVFTLAMGGVNILSERYFADHEARLRIRLSDTVSRLLHMDLPNYNLTKYTHGTSVATFRATINGNHYDFNAIKGFVQRKVFNVPFFLKFNWLTAQPKTKAVKFHDPEWLSCLPEEEVQVWIRAKFSDASTEELHYVTLEADKLQSVKLNPGTIIGLFAQPLVQWQVYTLHDGELRQYEQTYILTDEHDQYDDLFVFESRIGGLSTIRFTGQLQRGDSTAIESARIDEYYKDYFTEPGLVVEKNTGPIADRLQLFHALDFFRSPRKWHVHGGNPEPIHLIEPEIESVKGELRSYTFRFAYSDVKSAYPDWALPPHLLDLP